MKRVGGRPSGKYCITSNTNPRTLRRYLRRLYFEQLIEKMLSEKKRDVGATT